MRIARILIRNFRSIREAEIFPTTSNVLLGQNNIGKTTIVEAINLVLNPEITYRSNVIDENDFYCRRYTLISSESSEEDSGENSAPSNVEELAAEEQLEDTGERPIIHVEIVLTDLREDDEEMFYSYLVPWNSEDHKVVESASEGTDIFSDNAVAIRVFFDAWFDAEEDDFAYGTFFLPTEGVDRDDCPRFNREHKRQVGFLIYRDFRALTRPITLDPWQLFSQLLRSQDAKPKNFEDVLDQLTNSLAPLNFEPHFASLLNAYKAELERYLSLTGNPTSKLEFNLTDRTRAEIKSVSQLYTWDQLPIPIQKMGAGTRSLALLSILTLVMRRRGRGILVLEEPETFLFPHAQRRVIDECLDLADQVFVTTHSPYVLERLPPTGVGRVLQDDSGRICWTPLSLEGVKKANWFSRHLRKAHCEALMGIGALIVEGDSDRWWLTGVSRILNRETWKGRRQEALELKGIAVVNGDGYGDVIPFGEFYVEAGLVVVGLVDKIKDQPFLGELVAADFPTICMSYKDLEDLLAAELPERFLRTFLTEAPRAKNLPLDKTVVSGYSETQVRAESAEKLKQNKGSAFMHAWLLESLTLPDVPRTLACVVDMVSRHVAGEEMQTCSIAPNLIA